jgi:hypothetical protein
MRTTRSVLVVLGLVALMAASVASVSAFAGRTFTGGMTGAAELPDPGDPDGSGTFWVQINPGHESVCYSIDVTGVDLPIGAAHIHVGDASTFGPPVVTLQPPTEGSVSACATAPHDVLVQILRNPSNYYVNVHNAPFPGGALRGQLG